LQNAPKVGQRVAFSNGNVFSWLIWKKKTLENEIEISELKDHFSGFEFL